MSWQSGFAIGWRKRIGARVSDDEWNGFWAALPENAKLTPAPDVNDVATCPRCKIPIKFSRKIKLRHFQKGQKPRTTAQFEKRRVCNGDCLGRECVIIVRSFYDAGFEAADEDDVTDGESTEQAVEEAEVEAEVEAEAEAASEPAAPPTPSKVALEECSLHVRDADSPEPNQPKPRRRERKQRPVVILPFASAATSSAAAAGAAAAAGDDAPCDAGRVAALVSERSACKMNRDFARADQLRDELRSAHGVELNDAERTWRVRGGGRPPPAPPPREARPEERREGERDERRDRRSRSPKRKKRSRSRSRDRDRDRRDRDRDRDRDRRDRDRDRDRRERKREREDR